MVNCVQLLSQLQSENAVLLKFSIDFNMHVLIYILLPDWPKLCDVYLIIGLKKESRGLYFTLRESHVLVQTALQNKLIYCHDILVCFICFCGLFVCFDLFPLINSTISYQCRCWRGWKVN